VRKLNSKISQIDERNERMLCGHSYFSHVCLRLMCEGYILHVFSLLSLNVLGLYLASETQL